MPNIRDDADTGECWSCKYHDPGLFWETGACLCTSRDADLQKQHEARCVGFGGHSQSDACPFWELEE